MDKITKEIEDMAEQLAKSSEDPKEVLFKTITALGKDGIKARMPKLNEEEKSLLKAALEEMNLKKSKSVEFDKESQSAKVIQGNVMDTILQEEIGSDDADEKLMKPEAAKHNHQGNSVIGWEGQVIKASEWTDEEVDMMVGPNSPLMSEYDDDFSKAHVGFEKLKNKLSHEKGVNDAAGLAAAVGRKKFGKKKFQEAAANSKKMKKSFEDEETLFKSLFYEAKPIEMPKESEMTPEACLYEINSKLRKMRELKELASIAESEGKEFKSALEKPYNKLKAEIKALCDKHASLKKAFDEFDSIQKGSCPSCSKPMNGELKKCPCGYSMKKGESVPKKSVKEQEQEDAAATAKVAVTEKKGKVMKKSELVEQMNKSEEVLVKAIERLREKGMRKKMIKKSLISAGVEAEGLKKAMKVVKDKKAAAKKLVAAEAKEQGIKKSDENAKHILEEETQSNDTAQMTAEGKDLGDHAKTGEDNKKAQKDVNNTKVTEGIKKSIQWNPEDSLLKANTQGRNFHFNVGDFVEGILKAEEEEKTRKKAGKPARDEGDGKDMKKADVNDLIEKGQDTSWFQVDMKKSLEAQEALKTGKMTKSFADEDMATLLGLSPEDAKKILG